MLVIFVFSSCSFLCRKKNQKRLDDLNALRLPASLGRKIVNMEPKGPFFLRAKPFLHYRWEYARALARLFKRSLPYWQNSVQAKPIGGARLFCQAVFGSFFGIKKNERSEYTMEKWIIPYEACCLVTIYLLSNNLGNKKYIVQCNLMLIYSQLKTGKL